MRRRTLLAVASSLLAGCSGSDRPTVGSSTPSQASSTRLETTTPEVTTGETTTPETTTAETTTADATTTETTTEPPFDLVPADPSSMSADEVRNSLADRDCSEFAERPRTCPADDGRLSVSISPTVADLAGGAVEFAVENQTDEPFTTNYYDWMLQKWDGNRWRRIAPIAIPAPLDRLPAGESHIHRITPVEREGIDGLLAYATESDVTVGGLGPGVYGFSTQGYFESAPDEELQAGAVFGFAGRAPSVRPTDDVTGVERDGSTLLVRADAGSTERAELVVSLVDGPADADLLAEHVLQLGGLLNALPYAATDGVETIRYLGPADEVNVVDSYVSAVTPDDATRFGFREYAFELSVD